MESFLRSRRVLYKEYKDYVTRQSMAISKSAEEISLKNNERVITPISSLYERKEALARERQKDEGIKKGLIGVWSCVESCNTFKFNYEPESNTASLKSVRSKCKHIYYYFDDPIYGFMSVRLQTWAPYDIQIALNGREWLRRSLDKAKCGYILDGNKFLHIDDYELAQKYLDDQFTVNFNRVLNKFLPSVFPNMAEIIGPDLSYYWTFWQSEVAKDYIFDSSDVLQPLLDDFLTHALITGNGNRILRYFGRPVRPDGQPHPNTYPEIQSLAKIWYDGLRVRHYHDTNSVKFYNQHNVLRFEMTMNDPSKFWYYRHSERQKKTEPKSLMKIRKGVADTTARVEASKNVINRFTEQMSALEEKTPLGDILSGVSTPLTKNSKRYRALDVVGKDKELLRAISDPRFNVSGITNKELQNILSGKPWAKGMSVKQLSGRISRHLRLLREHGLIKKYPKQRRYMLTDKGRKLTTALEAALAASVNNLLKSVA
jgi:DNA-binding transcriptional ArsR family regulator